MMERRSLQQHLWRFQRLKRSLLVHTTGYLAASDVPCRFRVAQRLATVGTLKAKQPRGAIQREIPVMPTVVRSRLRLLLVGGLALAIVAAVFLVRAPSRQANASSAKIGTPFCVHNSALCTETHEQWNYKGEYTGHDEPSVLFYSNTAGSGNSSVYQLTIPSDPPTVPLQNATGGTFHFQLHPTFWFGMVLCDDQSAPNPGGSPLAGASV